MWLRVWFLHVLAQVCYFSSSSIALICFGVKKSTRNPASTQCDALSGISNKKAVTFLSDFPCSITELNLALKQLLDLYPEEILWDTDLIVRKNLVLFSMFFRFTKPQAELYQAVLDIQKSCLSLCSPGVSLEHIYSLMLSLIGQKLKDLGILKSSVTESQFFKVLEVFLIQLLPARPDYCIRRLYYWL